MITSLVEIYGLRIAAPLALPGRAVRDGSAPADVTFHLQASPSAADRWGARAERTLYRSATMLHGEPALLADRPGAEGWIRLRNAEGICFHLSPRGEEVWADWRAPLTEADAIAFFLGPVLGAVLRRRGIAALHASAVVLAGEAYLFLGSRGSGKSRSRQRSPDQGTRC